MPELDDEQPSAPARPASPLPQGDDWATRAVDMLDGVVGSIRNKTTVPITTAARAIVYGLLAAVMGIVALVLLAIALVRVADILLPGAVWSAHLAIGGLFSAAGLFLWSKRKPREDNRS